MHRAKCYKKIPKKAAEEKIDVNRESFIAIKVDSNLVKKIRGTQKKLIFKYRTKVNSHKDRKHIKESWFKTGETKT